MNYGDTAFPWDPNTSPQVRVSPSSPQSTLGFSSSPGSVGGRGRQSRGDPARFVPAAGRGRSAMLAVQNANFATGTASPSPHAAVKTRPCKNFSFFPSPVPGKPRLGCSCCPWGSVSSRLLLPAALYSAWYLSQCPF